MAGLSDPHLAELLAQRTKQPPEVRESPDSLNLSFSTGLEEEENRDKLAALNVEMLEAQKAELEGENQRLRILLRARENDIFKLKNETDELKIATTGGGLGSEKAIQRIVELSKKNRDLMSSLEAEKNHSKRLEAKLSNLNNQDVQRKIKSAVKAKKEEASAASSPDKEKQLKEKISILTAKHTEANLQLDTAKQEMKLLTKLLQREVGEGTTVQSVLANPNSWRGRAEQIALLQSKVNKTGDAPPPTRMEKQRQKDIRDLENKRKMQLQEIKKERDAMEGELVQSRKNYDAVKARNSTLSTEIKTLRAGTAALVEKGRHDDILISQLLEDKEKDTQQEPLQNGMTEEMEALRLSLAERESRISQLEEEITRTRENKLNDLRPCTHPRSAPEASPNKAAGFDVGYLLRATEVERDRLFELTDILNRRIGELESQKTENETSIKKYQRQLIDLEKLVEQLKCKKLPRCDACNSTATLNHPPASSQVAILEDEVDVLKSHVEAVSTERLQDLTKYKQLLDQSRQVFLAGLREMKISVDQ